MASDNRRNMSRDFDYWLRAELRSWGSRQSLPQGLRARLMLRAKELNEPQVSTPVQAGLTDVRSGVGGKRSSVLARLVMPTMELGLLSLRWVS